MLLWPITETGKNVTLPCESIYMLQSHALCVVVSELKKIRPSKCEGRVSGDSGPGPFNTSVP